MVPRKLSICFARFPYGGVGATSLEVPYVANWLIDTVSKLKSDSRIDRISHIEIADTPITMTRNQAVDRAKKLGADVLVMIDSDMYPDYHLEFDKRPSDKPFFSSSFDLLYEHYEKGPLVIASPYCGPPPHENVYIFKWGNRQSSHPNQDHQLDQYSRSEAAILSGIDEVAALPTGLIMYDMRIFDVVKPPYFYYEYEDEGVMCPACHIRQPGKQAYKGSTEDVAATRDMALIGQLKLGYNPVRCNWDAWSGHCKPKIVHRPKPIYNDQIGWKYFEAVTKGHRHDERMVIVGEEDVQPDFSPVTEHDYPPITDEHIRAEVTRRLRATTAADLHCILDLLKHVPVEGTVVEVGTQFGLTAVAMSNARPDLKIVCVDHFQGSPNDATNNVAMHYGPGFVRSSFRANVSHRFGNQVQLIEKDSLAAASEFDGQVDMVFIDADHEYAGVKADIEAWSKKVKPGGIISGHDYAANFQGVIQAVKEAFPVGLAINGSVWSVKKPPINRLAPYSYPEFEEDVPETIANGHAG